jgi:hypothetical protein
MKLYSFTINKDALVPSTPTVLSFVKSMIKMKKLNREMFTGLEVMKFAIDNNLWSTKQIEDKQLMTTWAYYLRTLKEIGLVECGVVGNGKKVISMGDLLEMNDDAERELEDEDMEKSCDEDEELERMMEEEAKVQAAE